MLSNCGVGEDSWEFLGLQQIQPVNPKRKQSWIFIGRTDAEAEAPILWPSDSKNWLIGKDPDAGKDWRQEEKGMIGDEMAGWHHWLQYWWLDGHEFEQAPGVGGEQGSLGCCSPWGPKELDMTERLNNNSWFTLLLSVSVVLQRESAIRIHTYVPSWIPIPFRSPQSTKKSSLCYTIGSH